MHSKLRLTIIGVVSFCLLLTWVSTADSVVKKLYIDGALVGEANEPNGLSWPYNRITIGAEGNRYYLYNEYIGKLDEFAIYGGVLSDSRIAAHYAAKDSNETYYAAVDQDNPRLWLRFEDVNLANGDIARNDGFVDRNGEYITTGGGAITQVTGINAGSHAINIPDRVDDPCDAINAQGHCVDVSDDGGGLGADLDGDVTIELWANYTDLNDYPRFFQHNGGWTTLGSYGLVAQLNDGNSMVVTGGNVANFIYFDDDINDGQWHYIVVTYDSTYEVNLPPTLSYVEEVEADDPLIWVRFEDENPVDSAGGDDWVGYGSNLQRGDKFGGIGMTALQNSNSDGAGIHVCSIAKGPNEPNAAETAVGDQYAIAPNDITIELWYKSLPSGQPQPAQYSMMAQQIGAYTREPNGPAFGLSDGQLRVFCGAPGHGTGIWYTGRYPADGDWHHIVVTFDEDYGGDPCSMHLQTYLDTVLVETTVTDPLARLGPEYSHMVFGAGGPSTYSYSIVPGYYDEIAVYAGILAQDRVVAHYAAWQPENCAEVIERGLESPEVAAIDRNQDCQINFFDFAIFAQDWWLCNDPLGGVDCPPNW